MIQNEEDFLTMFDQLAAKQSHEFYWLLKNRPVVASAENIDKSVTVTIYRPEYNPLVSVGDKIHLSKKSMRIANKSQKGRNNYMVHRLLKKQFKPMFIVTFVDKTSPDFNFQMKPYNF